jgi:hypothetical protein
MSEVSLKRFYSLPRLPSNSSEQRGGGVSEGGFQWADRDGALE